MISAGVLAGTKKANHDEVSYPGTPASAMVRTSGAAATRAAVVTPSARNGPDPTGGRPEATTAPAQTRRTASTAGQHGTAPRRGAAVGHVGQIDFSEIFEQLAAHMR